MTLITDDIKAVLFDHDDTLVDTYKQKTTLHKFIAKTYFNKTLSDEAINKHYGKPLEQMLCLLYDTDDLTQVRVYTHKHGPDYEKILFPETIDTIKRLKQTGKLIGIVTSLTREGLNYDLKRHNIPQNLIDYTQTSNEVNHHKPDPRVFNPSRSGLSLKLLGLMRFFT